jgi:hypothetical protein
MNNKEKMCDTAFKQFHYMLMNKPNRNFNNFYNKPDGLPDYTLNDFKQCKQYINFVNELDKNGIRVDNLEDDSHNLSSYSISYNKNAEEPTVRIYIPTVDHH